MKQPLLIAPRQQKPSHKCLPPLHLSQQLPYLPAAPDPPPHLPLSKPAQVKPTIPPSACHQALNCLSLIVPISPTGRECSKHSSLSTRPRMFSLTLQHLLKVDVEEWDSIQRRTKAYLCLYVKPDIFSLTSSDANFPTFKQKWDTLKQVYGGATGSTTIFNLWIQLT